ncbi:MAG TPA: YdcF family protein [Herbaspirillum sp.]
MSTHLLISTVVRTLALPPFNLLVLIGMGLLWSGWKPRAGRLLAAGALLLLILLCIPLVSNLLVQPLENLTAPLVSPENARAQAIVVLSADQMPHAPEYGGADIPDYIGLARLRYAARLQHETGLPILVSGGTLTGSSVADSFGAAMASALREDFRTPVKWIEGRSENTAENALYSAKILKLDGVQRILLVTDAMHMPRAQLAFTQAGVETVAAPTMFFGLKKIRLQSFLPSTEGLRRSHYALYEWFGLIWYKSRMVPSRAL